MYGHECGEASTQTLFRNNYAHSIYATDGGVGAHFYPQGGWQNCYEASHFAAWKTSEQGVSTHYGTLEVRMSHMTFMDNVHGGLSLMIGTEGDDLAMKADDIHIYGEIEADDCGGVDCYCAHKFGFMAAYAN